MNNDELTLVLSNDKILTRVEEIAKDLDVKYAGEVPVVIGIMRGCLYFLADLTQQIDLNIEIDMMSLSSYGTGSTSSGTVRILKDIEIDITNRHVVVVEDIIDTGTTLDYLREYFDTKKAKTVTTISIFAKEGTNKFANGADVVGFYLPDKFLVGYGLDYANKYRHLKDVYELKLADK
ncbi:MAG: hypoxanthine phosphoribosyltransferase [Spiroplasma sp.]|nr:hypoxanthine phosphoribosyltransferase [Mycoplasmatales bacterium]